MRADIRASTIMGFSMSPCELSIGDIIRVLMYMDGKCSEADQTQDGSGNS
jgi:hypothetical protein